MKVRLNALKITDEPEKYNENLKKMMPAQKKVNFKQIMDEGDRWVSGWVSLSKFNPEDWQEGKEIDLVITQKGKYWNCSLPTKETAAIAAVEEKNNANHEKVMEALRVLYAKSLEIDAKLEKLTEGAIQP